MTKQEKIIVSAYTGVLMCDFDDVHEYIQKKLGRTVWTHELANEKVWDEIKEKTKEEFLEICKREEPEIKKGKWIGKEKYMNSPEYFSWQCSMCGCVLEDSTLDKPYPFCPYCGSYNGWDVEE